MNEMTTTITPMSSHGFHIMRAMRCMPVKAVVSGVRTSDAAVGAELDRYVSALSAAEQTRLRRSVAALLDEIERLRD
jgi:hypothetical protein